MEKIKLSEYLEIVTNFEAGKITPEESEKQFKDFFGKLVIKSYMLHADKVMNLGKILFSMHDMEDEVAATAYLEAGRISYGLLAYCVNLQNDVEPLGVVFVVCDAIHQHGLYDYILQYCEKDYELFSKMLSDMINISHINTLVESAALFDNAAFDKWMRGMKELGNQLTPELLKGLVELNANTDSATQKLLSTLSEAAVSESSEDLRKALKSLPSDDKEDQEDQEDQGGSDDVA